MQYTNETSKSFDWSKKGKRYNSISIGYGKRSPFPEVPHLTKNPGPGFYNSIDDKEDFSKISLMS